MKKKGFTLIELLAVIVILALIVIIAVPKILDVIEKSERTAWGESAGLMAKAAELKYSEGNLTNTERNETYEFENGDFKSGSPTLTFKGDKPYSGKIVQEKGKTTLALISKNKKWCAIKKTGERIAKVYKIGKEIKEEDCKIEYTGSSDDDKPEVYTCPDVSTYPGKDLTSTEIDSDGYYIKDGYKFSINTTSNEATIVAYTGQTGETVDLVIPKTINNVPITIINNGIFMHDTFNSITISPNIKDMKYSLSQVVLNKLNLDYAIGLTSVSGLDSPIINNDITIACSKNATSVKDFHSVNVNGTPHKLIIQNLNNLTSIDLNSGEFTDVIIKDNPKLTEFKSLCVHANGDILIENSPITSIPSNAFEYGTPTNIILRNLPELTKIDNHAFAKDPGVTDLGNLKTLTLENLPKLEIIKYYAFYKQNVENLNFKGLDSLKTIEYDAFGYNKLSKISFEGMPNIEELGGSAFSNNEITDYDFTKAKKLIKLGGAVFFPGKDSSIVIKNVNFSGLTQSISGYFEYSSNQVINKIDFSNTGEGMNDFISKDLSMHGGNYKEINLSNSKIDKIPSTVIANELIKLDLTGCTELKTINMITNKLESLDLSDCTNLTSLSIYGAMSLTNLNLGKNTNITDINLFDNSIKEFDFSKLTNLKNINVNGSSHTKISIPASVTQISSAKSRNTITCIQIAGDSTRFDSNFEDIFGVTKSSVSSTCNFD